MFPIQKRRALPILTLLVLCFGMASSHATVQVFHPGGGTDRLRVETDHYAMEFENNSPLPASLQGSGGNLLLGPRSEGILVPGIRGQRDVVHQPEGGRGPNITRMGPLYYTLTFTGVRLRNGNNTLTNRARLTYTFYNTRFHVTLEAPEIARPAGVFWRFAPASAFNQALVEGRARNMDGLSFAGGMPRNRGVGFDNGRGQVFGFLPSPALPEGVRNDGESYAVTTPGGAPLLEYRAEFERSAGERDIRTSVLFLFAEEAGELEDAFTAETEILGPESFQIRGGSYAGYDPSTGLYTIRASSLFPEEGVTGPLQAAPVQVVSVTARNALVERSLHFGVMVPGQQPVYGVLADKNGFPLPEQTQASAAEEGTILAAPLEFTSPFDGKAVQMLLVTNSWGSLPAQTLGSRSGPTAELVHATGGRETAVFSPLPRELTEIQSVNLVSLRPLQAERRDTATVSMGLANWYDEDWNYLHPRRITFHHTGPFFTDYEVEYGSRGDRATGRARVRQFSQTDAVRLYLDARVDFRQQIRLPGSGRENLRLLSFTTAGSNLQYDSLTLQKTSGLDTLALTGNNSWAALGEPLSRRAGYAALHRSPAGNIGAYVLNARGTLGRLPISNVGASAFDGSRFVDLNFTATNDVLYLQPGDFALLEMLVVVFGPGGVPRLEEEQEALLNNEPTLTVYRGAEQEDFPVRLSTDGEVCEFSLRGGINFVPVLVEGFLSHQAPLVFQRGAAGWRPSPVMGRGMQWAQVYETDDGRSVGFAFPVPASPRVSQRYFVTQASSLGNLQEVALREGAVHLRQEDAARLRVTAPVLFAGLEAQVDPDGIAESEGEVADTRSLPVSVVPSTGDATVLFAEYSAARVVFRLSGGGRTGFVLEGLTPSSDYRLRSAGESEQGLATNNSGSLRFDLESRSAQEFTLERAGEPRFAH